MAIGLIEKPRGLHRGPPWLPSAAARQLGLPGTGEGGLFRCGHTCQSDVQLLETIAMASTLAAKET